MKELGECRMIVRCYMSCVCAGISFVSHSLGMK
jgi:hypothetical protein